MQRTIEPEGRLPPAALVGGHPDTGIHLALAGRYDLFRDELYFIVCGQHPAFGYVDQPPAVPLIAASLYRLGLGAFGVRLPAVLAAGATVWLAMRFVRLLDGDRLALGLAGLACAIAPMLMGLDAAFTTSAFEPLCWTALSYFLVAALRRNDDRALIAAGLVAGVTLEVKYALLFWITGLAIGLALTPERRVVRRPAFWMGALLGAALALPSVVWQVAHGLPFLELGEAARAKNADVALLPFAANQVMVMNPILAPLWISGLAAPFAHRSLRALRFVPIARW